MKAMEGPPTRAGRAPPFRPSVPAACPSCATAETTLKDAAAKRKGSTISAGVTCPTGLAEPQSTVDAHRPGLHARSERRMKVYRLNSPPLDISLTRHLPAAQRPKL